VKILRKLYIRSTNLTGGYQDDRSKLLSLYKLWAPFYEYTVRLDPAYNRNLCRMVRSTVAENDRTLDIGCGTGLGAMAASRVAKTVLGIDPSTTMLKKLEKKITKHALNNIETRAGFFPQAIQPHEKFNSIVTSFMLAHLSPVQRSEVIKVMRDCLENDGRVGMFGARGEVAPAFQTRMEMEAHLSSAGFSNYVIEDVDDIYRIAIAEK